MDTGDSDALHRRWERVWAEDLRFKRDSWYVVASILSWIVFWELARLQDNYVTIMVSMAFAVAFWIARTFLADVEPAQARRVEPCMMGEGR